jgi:hypothetical protein
MPFNEQLGCDNKKLGKEHIRPREEIYITLMCVTKITMVATKDPNSTIPFILKYIGALEHVDDRRNGRLQAELSESVM